jgi:Mg/Co/Ni transporter MgtE
VYDYVPGKQDWLDAGLPLDGELDPATLIGSRADAGIPTCGLEETVGQVRERVRAADGDAAVVLGEGGVVLGLLPGEAVEFADPEAAVESVMSEDPTTFRPSTSLQEAAEWMDEHHVDSILVTSADGSLIGVVRRRRLEDGRTP